MKLFRYHVVDQEVLDHSGDSLATCVWRVRWERANKVEGRGEAVSDVGGLNLHAVCSVIFVFVGFCLELRGSTSLPDLQHLKVIPPVVDDAEIEVVVFVFGYVASSASPDTI